MNALEGSVEKHYTPGNLQDRIERALETSGRSIDALSIDDLAGVEEYHIRGREATSELLSWTGIDEETRVLDVGCGIGGACRFIASTYGSHVTGLDLSREYCRVGRALSGHVGLAEQTTFQQGTALAMPFEDGQFDLALSLHVQMNIGDKKSYLEEMRRVLASGGQVGLYEICSGPGGEAYYPVPWADNETISFLSSPEELRDMASSAGLRTVRWEDLTSRGLKWFEQVLAKVQQEGPSPVGLHLHMGPSAPEKMTNVVRNLREDRISIVQALLEKA